MSLLSAKLNEVQTCLGRATLLANFEVMDGKPEEINTLLDRYGAVSAAQVQAIAKKYLEPNRRFVLAIQPAPFASKGDQ